MCVTEIVVNLLTLSGKWNEQGRREGWGGGVPWESQPVVIVVSLMANDYMIAIGGGAAVVGAAEAAVTLRENKLFFNLSQLAL